MSNPPKVEGKDDVTGEDLECREDDSEEIVAMRITTHREMTVPILGHYAEIVIAIQGSNSVSPAEVAPPIALELNLASSSMVWCRCL